MSHGVDDVVNVNYDQLRCKFIVSLRFQFRLRLW